VNKQYSSMDQFKEMRETEKEFGPLPLGNQIDSPDNLIYKKEEANYWKLLYKKIHEFTTP
jgi:hypothetical protein